MPKKPSPRALKLLQVLVLLLGLALAAGLTALVMSKPIAKDPEREGRAPVTEDKVEQGEGKKKAKSFFPATAPARRVRPLLVMAPELTDLGQLTLGQGEAPKTLVGIGWGPCVGGWGIQGFYRDQTGKPMASPTLLLPTLEMPSNTPEPWTFQAEAPEQRTEATLWLDGDGFLLGSVEHMQAPPFVSIKLEKPADFLSLQPDVRAWSFGCFSTGTFTLNGQTKGFVTASPNGELLWKIRLVLDLKHHITVWMRVRPIDFQAHEVFAGDLNDVFNAPDQQPVRAFFEQISEQGVSTLEPIKEGTLKIMGTEDSWRDPWVITIEGATFPKAWKGWKGALEARAKVRFPKQPQWEAVPMF